MVTSDPSIGIYQPLFNEAIHEYLDPGFIALDWRHNPSPELRELALHDYISKSRLFERHRLTGLLSPKFFSKTGLTSHDVNVWIAANPGYDLYCIDGRPFVPYTCYNAMERAERRHGPRFEQRLRRLGAEMGIPLAIGNGRQTSLTSFHCNYWVGTEAFWRKWSFDVVAPFRRLRDSHSEIARAVFTQIKYRSPTPVFLVAFIYERMLSLYLASRKIRYIAYPWTGDQVLKFSYHPVFKEYLQAIVPWVQQADRQGGWTTDQREELASGYAEICKRPMVEGYEADAFNPLNYDLPRYRAVRPAHDRNSLVRRRGSRVSSILFDPYAGQMKYLADFLASSDDVSPGS